MALFGPNVERMKAARDIRALCDALDHRKPDVRAAAATALGELGDVTAIELLAAVAERETLESALAFREGRGDFLARLQVAEAAKKSLAKLQSLQEADARSFQDARGDVTSEIRAIVEGKRAPAPTDPLKRVDEKIARAKRFQRIARHGSAAVEPLLAFLSSQDLFERAAAATALFTMAEDLRKAGDLRAVDPLRQRLADASEDAAVRSIVEDALQRFAGQAPRGRAGG